MSLAALRRAAPRSGERHERAHHGLHPGVQLRAQIARVVAPARRTGQGARRRGRGDRQPQPGRHRRARRGGAAATSTACRWRVLRNDANYGLGGSHKVAIARSGGRRPRLAARPPRRRPGATSTTSCRSCEPARTTVRRAARRALHARRPAAGLLEVRTVGNHLYNAMFSLAAGARMHDLGSRPEPVPGRALRRRRVPALRRRPHVQLPPLAAHGGRGLADRASSRSRGARRTSARTSSSSSQGLRTLGIVGRLRARPRRFFAADHARRGPAYTATPVAGPAVPR